MILNNKGFAISGILYTLMIIFFLILISIMAGLNSRKKIMEKSISVFSNKYVFGEIEEADSFSIPALYVFSSSDLSKNCYSFLNSSYSSIEEVTFTTEECNNNKANLTIIGYYKLGK